MDAVRFEMALHAVYFVGLNFSLIYAGMRYLSLERIRLPLFLPVLYVALYGCLGYALFLARQGAWGWAIPNALMALALLSAIWRDSIDRRYRVETLKEALRRGKDDFVLRLFLAFNVAVAVAGVVLLPLAGYLMVADLVQGWL